MYIIPLKQDIATLKILYHHFMKIKTHEKKENEIS